MNSQPDAKKEIFSQLQKEIYLLQGIKTPNTGHVSHIGLGPVEAAFPNGIFPTGVIHEFLSSLPEHTAASGGFIAGLLQTLMKHGGACLWIATNRKLFPPALQAFGVAPDRIIFVDLKKEKDVIWAAEEALKCEGLAAVIAEVDSISLTQSRRLQLTVEKSKVTGFLLRKNMDKLSTSTCAARWQIKPIASELEEGMPGVGFPRWNVALLKVRNGNPGSWDLEWNAEGFSAIEGKQAPLLAPHYTRYTG